MAGFGFSEEQEMFRQEIRRFAQRELAPGAKERAKQEGYSREIMKRMAELGLLSLGVPPEYGGQGADRVTLGVAVEELAKVDMAAGMIGLWPAGLAQFLSHGSEELRQKYLPAMVKGECTGCLPITEPHCGSDAGAIRTTAIREGDYYILNGEKTSSTMGMMADMGMLPAKTDPQAGIRGITFFLVPLDLPGITRSRFIDMGWRPLTRASIFLDNVRLPVGHRVGEEGKGYYIIAQGFDFQRVGLSIIALSLAQSSLEEAINYAKQRTAFGQPIAKFEGISFKLAEHATYIEVARLLCYRALWLADQGLPHSKEAAMCKWLCPYLAVNAIHDALLIHGHVAYSEDYPIEQRLRDAIGYEMADGTAQIMKLIVARQLLGR